MSTPAPATDGAGTGDTTDTASGLVAGAATEDATALVTGAATEAATGVDAAVPVGATSGVDIGTATGAAAGAAAEAASGAPILAATTGVAAPVRREKEGVAAPTCGAAGGAEQELLLLCALACFIWLKLPAYGSAIASASCSNAADVGLSIHEEDSACPTSRFTSTLSKALSTDICGLSPRRNAAITSSCVTKCSKATGPPSNSKRQQPKLQTSVLSLATIGTCRASGGRYRGVPVTPCVYSGICMEESTSCAQPKSINFKELSSSIMRFLVLTSKWSTCLECTYATA
mmetsp:Transcript_6752/g.11870  ORF Transcript_6752/g.11870 Transcript_6752/m.11870 type:complete len:288 (+) Transcript_6752:217-1080(+)